MEYIAMQKQMRCGGAKSPHGSGRWNKSTKEGHRFERNKPHPPSPTPPSQSFLPSVASTIHPPLPQAVVIRVKGPGPLPECAGMVTVPAGGTIGDIRIAATKLNAITRLSEQDQMFFRSAYRVFAAAESGGDNYVEIADFFPFASIFRFSGADMPTCVLRCLPEFQDVSPS